MSARTAPAAAVGGPGRRAVSPALAFALVVALAPAAFASAPRTIVVRGHALALDGRPISGARVVARGTVSVSTMTDANGRYTLSVPLGMPAALRRAPFRLEVRAEAAGRRLPLLGGGAALVLDAAWQPATGRVRVQSNRQAASTAVATALEVEDVPIAWIDADFGGEPREAGAGSFTQDAALPDGSRPPPASPMPAPRNSAPAAAPAPRNSAPPAVPAPRTSAPPVVPAPRNSAPTVRALSRDTVATVPQRADSSRAPATAARPSTPAPGGAKVTASVRTVAAPAPRNSQVRAIDPLARHDSVAVADTCRCSLRGTVEIDWPRPLEDHTPVTVELDAPGARAAEVSLFMGAPREFRFGPLPCGDWRLRVRAGGRLRYTEAGGDSARIVHCAGAEQTRVVLLPVRR